jgi:hypothetical protein
MITAAPNIVNALCDAPVIPYHKCGVIDIYLTIKIIFWQCWKNLKWFIYSSSEGFSVNTWIVYLQTAWFIEALTQAIARRCRSTSATHGGNSQPDIFPIPFTASSYSVCRKHCTVLHLCTIKRDQWNIHNTTRRMREEAPTEWKFADIIPPSWGDA